MNRQSFLTLGIVACLVCKTATGCLGSDSDDSCQRASARETLQVDQPKLSNEEIQKMIELAITWKDKPWKDGGDSEKGIDCSHLVAKMIKTIKPNYVYQNVATIRKSKDFVEVKGAVLKGDFVSWSDPGHIGIVIDPEKGDFIGAQSSGVAQANYKTGDPWSKTAKDMKFLRILK